jgi:hypothetical protein
VPPARSAREQLERQLVSVVGFLDDHEQDELLDVGVARLRRPVARAMLPDGSGVHQVEALPFSRHGWVVGIVVRQLARTPSP